MSVAFQSNTGNRVRPLGFAQPQGMWIYNSSSSSDTATFTGDDRRTGNFPPVVVQPQEDDNDRDSSSSSSIGNNSDASGGGADSDDDGGNEVQSLFQGSLHNLCDLEDALPVKRGISTFYAGKSKSYTSLADAVSVPSIQDIVKPEDAYNRKRKNMLAHNIILDKNCNLTCKNGISKRFANSNRGALAHGLNNNNDSNEAGGQRSSLNSSPGGSLPPLPARPRRLAINESSSDSSPRIYCSPWRSLSLSDLQHATGATSSRTGSFANKRDEEDD